MAVSSLNNDRNASGVEVEQPGEKEKIKQVSDQFNRFQMMSMSIRRESHLVGPG